jgi:hypothetical protein
MTHSVVVCVHILHANYGCGVYRAALQVVLPDRSDNTFQPSVLVNDVVRRALPTIAHSLTVKISSSDSWF